MSPDEARLVTHIMQVWREEGVPPSVPLFITESNLSSQHSEAYMDIWSGLWLADYIGAFLGAGGNAVYYFHYMPGALQPGHNSSPGTFNFFSAGADLKPRQPLAQFFTSQLINLEWLQPGSGAHRMFVAGSDVRDGVGHTLVTAYPVLRPDGDWALLVVNKDQDNEHSVTIEFSSADGHGKTGFTGPVSSTVFGRAQYQRHPLLNGGTADPDGPAVKSVIDATPATRFTLPAASVTVLRGHVTLPAAN